MIYKNSTKTQALMLIVSILCIIAAFCYWFFWWQFIQTTDNAYVRADITPIAPKVSGYIAKIFFDDGAEVNAENALIKIDDAEYLESFLKAQYGVKAASTNLEQVKIQVELKELAIQSVEAKVKSAEAEYNLANEVYERSEGLIKNNYIPQERYDATKADFIKADAALRESKIQLAFAKLELDNTIAEKSKLEDLIRDREASLKLAAIDLNNTVLKSPSVGVIGQRSCKVGQYVRPGNILMYVIPLHNLWVIANFKETQVSRMKLGQVAEVTIDAFPGEIFEGLVAAIYPASGAEFSLLPPDNATGNFTKVVQRIPVKIILKNPKNIRVVPGMSAYVTINTKH